MARPRFNWRTAVGLGSVLFGLSWGDDPLARALWHRSSALIAVIFVVMGLVLVVRSLAGSIVFSETGIEYRNLRGRRLGSWPFDGHGRIRFERAQYLSRSGFKRTGCLVLENSSTLGHGVQLPAGRWSNQARWAALLLDEVAAHRLDVYPDAVDQLRQLV